MLGSMVLWFQLKHPGFICLKCMDLFQNTQKISYLNVFDTTSDLSHCTYGFYWINEICQKFNKKSSNQSRHTSVCMSMLCFILFCHIDDAVCWGVLLNKIYYIWNEKKRCRQLFKHFIHHITQVRLNKIKNC